MSNHATEFPEAIQSASIMTTWPHEYDVASGTSTFTAWLNARSQTKETLSQSADQAAGLILDPGRT